MPPAKFCETTPKNTQITPKITHTVYTLFLGFEGGEWHSAPLRTLVPVFNTKGHLVASVLQTNDRGAGHSPGKRRAFDCTLNKGVNDEREEKKASIPYSIIRSN